MALRYCFEQDKVLATLNRSKPKDLAVIDTDGVNPKWIRKAVDRGVYVYGYLNIGALEKERSYYTAFKSLRLANYEGWAGEYWIDPTDPRWQEHILDLAKKIKATGAIGLYLDNTDIYWMCKEGFREKKTYMLQTAPRAEAVYSALSIMITGITTLRLIVMPNGGDEFVRRFIGQFPGVIQTINQESLFYEDFKRLPKEETAYRKAYMKWAAKRISGKVRGIEYCKKPSEIAYVKTYYAAHGWDVYISKHKNLEGD